MLKHVRTVVGALMALVISISFSSPVIADDSGRYLDVALLGDSYTAGNGAGSYYGPANSYRSTRNWGHVYVDWLNEQGVQTTVRNLAVSGGVTEDVLTRQIPLLDPHSDLVMLTVGGNDIKFENIVKNCFVALIRSYSGCEKAMKYAETTFPAARANIIRIFEEIQRKVADDARIVLVGYPLLSIDSDYSVSGWLWGAYPAAKKVREFGQFATREQTQLVADWNANPDNKVKVTFVPTELHFAGHEPDPEVNGRNPERWLNEMLEDEGDYGPEGVIISKDTGLTEIASWYHPNIAGHREIARLLQSDVGLPGNIREKRSTARDIDVVFAVETTQITDSKLGEMKAQMSRLIREITASASGAGAQARFALVSYRDVPAPALEPITRLTALGEDGVEAAVDALAANGPSARENLDKAIGQAISQFDRPAARKVVMMLGDLDSANTSADHWEALAREAFSKSTAEIIGIDINNERSEQVTALARRTGGYVTTVDALRVHILPDPVAALTLPEVAQVGHPVTLDASASTAEGTRIVRYEWDVDNDGNFDLFSYDTPDGPAVARLPHTWDAPTDATVTLRVFDEYDRMAIVSVPLKITIDGDLIEDGDNCPLHPNPDQADEDLDGIGDVCDPTPHGVSKVPDTAPVVELPIAPIGVVPDTAPTVELPIAPIGVVPDTAPVVELPIAPIGVVPDTAPFVPELPIAPIGVVPDTAPVVELPIAPIGVVPDTAPTVELPIAPIGVVPDTAPTVELPIAPIGVVPDSAPIAPALPIYPLPPQQNPSTPGTPPVVIPAPGGSSQKLAVTGYDTIAGSALAGALMVLGCAALMRRRQIH